MNRDDVIRMAREAGVKSPDGPFPARGSFSLPELMGLCGQAYAAGAAAERQNYEHTLALQQQSYEREIQIEVEAERAACIDDCNAEARDDGTAQRIVERIRARGKA
jgi:hypothetical protein